MSISWVRQSAASIGEIPGKIVKSANNPQAIIIYMDEPLFKENFEFYNEGVADWAKCNHCKVKMEAIKTSVHPKDCPNWPQKS